MECPSIVNVVAGAGFEPTNIAVKVRCLATWLTRNIMPVGIQVIIEPSQAKSVVPCSLWQSSALSALAYSQQQEICALILGTHTAVHPR